MRNDIIIVSSLSSLFRRIGDCERGKKREAQKDFFALHGEEAMQGKGPRFAAGARSRSPSRNE